MSLALIHSPKAELLCKPAVIGFCSGAEGQSEFFCGLAKLINYAGDFFRSCLKKILKALSFLRGFRMKWKGPPVNVNIVFFLKFFNTPGNEITPGSNVI